MHTIQLNVHDSVYDHFMKILGKFKNHEIDIISTNDIESNPKSQFERIKAELHADFENLQTGKSKSYSIQELEESLDQIIKKYEN